MWAEPPAAEQDGRRATDLAARRGTGRRCSDRLRVAAAAHPPLPCSVARHARTPGCARPTPARRAR
eukprot:2440326-Prymnesium_polylepis.1